MSLIKLSNDRFEYFTLITNPRQAYSSSSLGTSGSVYLWARRSDALKDAQPLGISSGSFVDNELELLRSGLSFAVSSSIDSGGGDISSGAESFMTKVGEKDSTSLNNKKFSVTRCTPTSGGFEDNILQKSSVINSLMPYYRSRYPEAHFAYTNYHSLNFFTASSVPSNSAIIYPNSSSNGQLYSPTGSFTVDFFINPRYTTLEETDAFHAGTILHLSSTLALSLVTGSQTDEAGLPSAYRLILQLSHSANTNPSNIDLTIPNNQRISPDDLTFVSDDNILRKNTWNHVSVRWGTNNTNAGTGSFVVNGVERGMFNVPSSSIHDPDGCEALIVGNFYDEPPGDGLTKFFNANASENEGVVQLTELTDDPSVTFSNPLNAEIHDLKIFGTYRSIEQIVTSSMQGTNQLTDLLFYVPPFFVRESPSRIVPANPFHSRRTQTHDPFNIEYSFSACGHLINLENFVREFVQGTYPRLFHLTASTSSGVLDGDLAANDYLYATGSIKKRNLTILPCDNGQFVPDFSLLLSGTAESIPSSGSNIEKFVSDTGAYNERLITLRNLVPSAVVSQSIGTLVTLSQQTSNYENVTDFSSIVLDEEPSELWQPYIRTQDASSNQVVFFDISNMFFGRRIEPGTVVITDEDMTGSNGRVSITLKDDGCGNLYRADADTAHATWASVGNVFYNEGIALVKSPNLPLFGKDQHELSFQGERHIHVMRINVLCPAGQVNSSSNPVYTPVSATLNANDSDPAFVYITGLTYHDENLNVVMRTQLAQPIVKRNTDKFLFATKIDF